jgi:eukaryotic-like serine/threonine-protein kinase
MQQIADYRVLQPLGAGNGGQVFICEASPRLRGAQPQVAVKLIEQPAGEPELHKVAEELQRFVAAADPYLVGLHDVGLSNGRLYIAMEHCPHGSLAGAHGRLDHHTVARAVSHAARGVHALHEAGIAHRNIKPSNILLGAQSGKLSEPGLTHLITPGQTVTGVGHAGAIEFMEPGVVRGERAARASDIWSLGAVLHEALTGMSVYGALPGGSLLAALRHVLSNAATVSPQVPEPWQAIVQRCVAADRADRYSTARELADEIDRVEGLVGA